MSFTPKTLSQRDPRWKDEKLGFDDTVTIGTDGSTLVCLAMLVNGYGFTETPSSMNRKLKDMGSGIGFLGSLIVWPGLPLAFPKISFRRIVVCRDQPAPLDEINTSLDAGQPLVIEIDESPSPGLQNHWVVLYARQGSDYLMLDPWPLPPDNIPVTLTSRYGLGCPLSEFITTVAWFDAVESPVPAPVPAYLPGTGLDVRVQTAGTDGIRLQSGPATSAIAIAVETPGTQLHCLESDAEALSKIGVINQWLQVRDPNGLEGFVAAWYVDQVGGSTPTPAPVPAPAPVPIPPPTSAPTPMSVTEPAQAPIPTPTPPSAPLESPEALTVFVSKSIGSVGLRLRDQPAKNSSTLAILSAGTELTILESSDQALPKIGQVNQWLNVRDGSGILGYVAARFVELKFPLTPAPAAQPLMVLVSSQASAGLRLRDRPSDNGNVIEVLMPGTLLTVLEPASTGQAKIGVVNQWLNVKRPGGMTGYVAAWYVTT